MRVISASAMPRVDIALAATCRFSIKLVANALGAIPELESYDRAKRARNRYWQVCLELSTGRFATLTQAEARMSVLEIGLEIEDDEIFREGDLVEVIALIKVPEEYVARIRGEFKWV